VEVVGAGMQDDVMGWFARVWWLVCSKFGRVLVGASLTRAKAWVGVILDHSISGSASVERGVQYT